MFQTDVLSHHLASCSCVAFHSRWELIMCLTKSLLNMNVKSHFINFSSTIAGFGLCLTMCLFSFEAIDAIKSQKLQCKSFRSSVDGKSPMWPSLVFTTSVCTLWVYMRCAFSNTFTFQCFITEVALDFTTFVSHVNFQITRCVEDSRAIFTFDCLFNTNTLCHVTAPTIVWIFSHSVCR